MIGRGLVVCILTAQLLSADDANRTVEIALANALNHGDVKAAMALFDPKAEGAARVRSDVERLMRGAELVLEIKVASGVWALDVTSRDAAAGITHRQAKVLLRTAGELITSFEPADFFQPPHGLGAWNALYAFAGALNDDTAPPTMEQFDRTMGNFGELKNGVMEMWNRYQIDSSLDLLSNEGDDRHRTLRVDWTLTLKNPQDPVDSTRREQTVNCRMERRGETWRIVGFDPASFFELSKR
jgi:hypothetical protein